MTTSLLVTDTTKFLFHQNTLILAMVNLSKLHQFDLY
jgi:hypothetical protein